MSSTFSDRLARIDATQNAHAVDQIGAGNRDASLAPAPLPEPATFDQRLRATIITHGLLGFIWMFPTGWVLGHYDTLLAVFPHSGTPNDPFAGTANALWMLAMGSFLLFMTYFRFRFPVLRRADTGIATIVVYSSGLVGGFLGYGPINFLNNFAQTL